MNVQDRAYWYQIGGDAKGISGNVYGGNITFVITDKSEAAIRKETLIKGSPYLGLKKFRDRDQNKFFGREQLIADFSKDLEKYNLLLLIGASGIGKSSLVQAGLIPSLFNKLGASNLDKLIFVPHKNPFESLYKRVPDEYNDIADEYNDIATEINPGNNDGLIKLINELKEYSPQWIIFIDQFEEIFTRTPKRQRDQFIANLVSLIKQQDSSVKLIMAMRYDFLVNISKYGDFNNQLQHKILLVGDMSESELKLAIAEPAARNGVTFEKDLVEIIIRDFKKQAGSLPLLQYTLNLLWEKASISDENRVLRTTTYDDLGGVSGALEKQANYIYNEKLKNDEEKKAAKQIFIELIDLVDKEPVSRRVEKSELINKDSIRKSALNTLIDNRLLVSGRDESTTVEVAHEELLRSWGIIQTLIEEQREIILLRSRLSGDAAQWDERRKQDEEQAKAELWRGYKLEQVLELIDQEAFGSLDENSNKFIQASIELRDRLQEEKKQQKLSTISRLTTSSQELFDSNKDFDSLLASISAGKEIKQAGFKIPDDLEYQVKMALQQSVLWIKERNRLEDHEAGVFSVSFSPDGKLLASGSVDRTIKLWNATTGKLIKTLTEHNDIVNFVSFSPSGKLLVSASDGIGIVNIWNMNDVNEWQKIASFDQYGADGNGCNGVCFSPDETMLAVVGSPNNNIIILWDFVNDQKIATLQDHKDRVNSVSFSIDGKWLASGSRDTTIKIWDVKEHKVIKTLNAHQKVVAVKFSPDDQHLASGSDQSTIKLWDVVDNWKEKFSFSGHQNRVTSLSFSPDGQRLASVSFDSNVKLWHLPTRHEIATLTGHGFHVSGISFHPSGSLLASGGRDHTIKIWDVRIRKEINQLTRHTNKVTSVSFSPDGKYLASASWDKTIKIFDVEQRQEIKTLTEHNHNHENVESVKFSPNGKYLASAGWGDNNIKLWNFPSFEEFATLQGHNHRVENVNFSPDGKYLASASRDKTIKIWNVEEFKEIATLKEHKSEVYNAIFSPNGKYLASVSGNNDPNIRLWDVTNPQEITEIAILNGHFSKVSDVSFHPSGEILASSSEDQTIKLWNIENIKNWQKIDSFNHQLVVNNVSFSPDGKLLASGSDDKMIKLWYLQKLPEIREIDKPIVINMFNGRAEVNSVSFSPDQSLLASGNTSGQVILWDLEILLNLTLDELLERGCKWICNYLQHNPNVKEEDRHLCDGIATQR